MDNCSKCGIETNLYLQCQSCFDKWHIEHLIKMANKFTKEERNRIYIEATHKYNGVAFDGSLGCCFLSDNYREFIPSHFPEFMIFSPGKPTEHCWWEDEGAIALGLAFMITMSE